MLLLFTGCSSSSNEQFVQCVVVHGEPKCPNIKKVTNREDYEVAKDAYQVGLNYEDGSLYSDSYMFSLYSDKRAYRVGDILTVVLNERTQSSKSADANLDKDTDVDVSVPFAGNLNVTDFNLGIGSSTEFDGSSSASQQNYLSGAITVRVIHVLSNGTLVIKGRKQIQLNQGDEYIDIEGLVRPDDIDVANRISSLRVAEAQISYTGHGTLADASSPGWFTSLFSRYLNPF
ncbi:flagellar basal body L-ring protein FlgH [Pseudoalteromonas shioyasakiensis]|uniref:flagellar basal body L-ring protein FlgH n=1 Tax=Pseudoalteromonas shioyasakiensis TaxID=1190813 RepID=UPI0021180696|nr:flagellar basal body L-ring protein FlgH [Pseudoalteromonas shioyasakiensis]